MRPIDVDVLILAGGYGTRAESYLGDTPKFLAPLDGVGTTVASHLLSTLIRADFRRVVLALASRSEIILKAMPSVWRHVQGAATLDVLFSIEPAPSGTASAIHYARRHLRSDHVMILNGDTVLALDFEAILARHRDLGTLVVTDSAERSTGCVVMSEHDLDRLPGGKLDIRRDGVLTTNRPWFDVGTLEGYTAARAWIKGEIQ